MNAVLKHKLYGQLQSDKTQPVDGKRGHRYGSPEQEKIVKYVLEKHKVTLRNLAK